MKKPTPSAGDTEDSGASVSTTVKFLRPSQEAWLPLQVDSIALGDDKEKERAEAQAKGNQDQLKDILLSSLQMHNLAVLAGCGTSLGDVGGPSMGDLWKASVNGGGTKPTDEAKKVIKQIKYDEKADGQNIEALLSQCEAHLQISRQDTEVQSFVSTTKGVILDKCRGFLKDENLSAHKTMLHRLARRRVRDPRLKLFTTNYDICFERAAGLQSIIVNDGFSFSQPRMFDPRFFDYDIVRRKSVSDKTDYLEGVIHLLKLHGSVNWANSGTGRIEERMDAKADEVCLIYPAAGKYQQSYIQPHLETFARFTSCLREPNTCLLVLGFGFNDLHLAEPILAAAQTNPSFRLIVVDYQAEELIKDTTNTRSYWTKLAERARNGSDIFFVNATFSHFASLIPDLRALTPAQQLEQAVKKIGAK